jgi:hypothetical protein
MNPQHLLRNEIFGDLWRGGVGAGGSLLAIISSTHEDIDAMIRTAGFIVGFLSSIAMLISICQRIYKTHKEKDKDES